MHPNSAMEVSKNEADNLPISDNNVSTTNDSLIDEPEWENDADINVRFIVQYTLVLSVIDFLTLFPRWR